MKRSEINTLIRDAEALFTTHGLALPPWARWTAAEWAAHPRERQVCASHQMGWDITDFGLGRFRERGLILLCTRNGIVGAPGERSYAEKLMVVGENQETPFHRHSVKVEDIIVRGGGTLVVEVFGVDADGRELGTDVEILCDATRRTVGPREPMRFEPGESVTLFPGMMHRFWGEEGRGPVAVGEVSLVNDDLTDNIFLEPIGRFAAIEEDEPAFRPLWSELTPA